MKKYNSIYDEIHTEIVRQSDNKKSFSHASSVWATIVIDYLGRAVRRVFTDEAAKREDLIKVAALVVVWIRDLK